MTEDGPGDIHTSGVGVKHALINRGGVVTRGGLLSVVRNVASTFGGGRVVGVGSVSTSHARCASNLDGHVARLSAGDWAIEDGREDSTVGPVLDLVEGSVAVVVVGANSGSLGVGGVVGRTDDVGTRDGLVGDDRSSSDHTDLGVLGEALLGGRGLLVPPGALARARSVTVAGTGTVFLLLLVVS